MDTVKSILMKGLRDGSVGGNVETGQSLVLLDSKSCWVGEFNISKKSNPKK